jgi:hypothetical protein
LILLFNFDLINGSEPIKFGLDFKFKVKVLGRSFYFWLNSTSIRRIDMPNLYAPSSFDIPETVTDDEMKQLLLPNNIVKKPEVKKQ